GGAVILSRQGGLDRGHALRGLGPVGRPALREVWLAPSALPAHGRDRDARKVDGAEPRLRRAGDHDRVGDLPVDDAVQDDHAVGQLLAEGLGDGTQVLAADALEHAADELYAADLLDLRRAARAAADRQLPFGVSEIALELLG